MTFIAGSGPGSQFSIDLTIIDDDLCEGQETITAALSASAPGQFIVGQDQCTIFINDNDGELLYTCIHGLHNNNNYDLQVFASRIYADIYV